MGSPPRLAAWLRRRHGSPRKFRVAGGVFARKAMEMTRLWSRPCQLLSMKKQGVPSEVILQLGIWWCPSEFAGGKCMGRSHVQSLNRIKSLNGSTWPNRSLLHQRIAHRSCLKTGPAGTWQHAFLSTQKKITASWHPNGDVCNSQIPPDNYRQVGYK